MITARPDQSKFRQSVTYADQHGRSWLTAIDAMAKKADGSPQVSPCIPFMPKDWNAPLDTPPKYLTIPDGTIGKLWIDYDAWIEDARAGDRAHQEALFNAALTLYGDKAASAMEQVTPELRRYVGRGPMPVKFVQAARAGNRWVLGQSQPNGQPWPADYVPQWALSIIEYLRPLVAEPDASDFADEVLDEFVDEQLGDPEDESRELADSLSEAERFAGYEEEVDPAALGGHTVPVVATRAPKAQRGRRAA